MTNFTPKHPSAIEACTDQTMKHLKEWAEHEASNMRVTYGCSPEEACYVVREAMITWSQHLYKDHEFTKRQARIK